MASTIVVPLDGTANADRALEPALDLARGFGTTVTLFRAVGDDLDEAGREVADRVQTLGRYAAVPILHHGFESRALADELRRFPGAAVCMVSDLGAGGDDVLGPVAEDVIESGRAPALLLGPSQTIRPEPGRGLAVVCTDGSVAAASIEPAAVAWTSALGLDVQVLVVLAAGRPDLAGIPIERVLREVQRLAFRLERQGLTVTTEVLEDGTAPAHTILEHVDAHPVGLIATSTRGHRHALHTVLGDTVEDLLRQATVPILIDQPLARDVHA